MTRIQTRSTTTKESPSGIDILDREIAYSFLSGKLFIKNPVSGAIDVIGGKSVVDAVNSGSIGAVTSVAGKTGVVTLTTSDIGGYVAPTVSSVAGRQGNIVLSTADISGYVAPTVSSVAGKTGAVTILSTDVSGLGTAATQNSTAFATAAQGVKADTALQSTSLGAANGVASLDSTGKLNANQVPDLAITQFLGTVASQAAMLALTGQSGDWVIRSDSGTTWVITGTPTNNISSWTQLSYPGSTVSSVAGRTGAVTLTTSDIGGLGTVATRGLGEFVRTINGGLPDASGNVNVASASSPVTSVAGRIGAVTLTTSDIGGYVAPPVTSVAGKIGAVTLSTGDISGYVAPTVTSVAGRQGSITLTTADIGGYVAPTVTSVAGKTGAVSLTNADITGLGDIATRSVSEFATAAQGTLATNAVPNSAKGAANGVATLDASGKILSSQVPDIALVQFLGTVASQAAMLGLIGQTGDWAIRSDLGTTWVITGATPSQLSSWTQLSYPATSVTSVAGKTGVVTLTTSDIGGYVAPTVSSVAGRQGAITLTTADIGGYVVPTVSSVAGKTGAVTLANTDVTGLGDIATRSASEFATAAQGTLATNAIPTAQKGAVNGVASLDASGKLLTTQIPDMALVQFLGTVVSQAAMLALVGQSGDWAIRSDLGTTWVITGATPSQLSSWTQLSYPVSSVTSVAGKTGAVTLTTADVGGYVAPTVSSVAGKTGAVNLVAGDIGGLGTAATSSAASFATAAQGTLASTALQSVPIATTTVVGGVKQGSGVSIAGDGTISATGTAASNATATVPGLVQLAAGQSAVQLSRVASTGVYTDLTSLPTLGTAAAQNTGAFATAAQGTLASTALQQATGDLRYVRSVNGTGPDGSGNVVVATSGGAASFSTLTGVPTDNVALTTSLAAKVDKAVIGSTVTVSGNMIPAHVGKVVTVDTTSAAVVLTLVPGVIFTASDRITYKRKGGNALSFTSANGATLNDPHLMQIIDGDLVVIAGTALDTATVAGMPGDLVRKTRANLYTARQAIAPATLTVVGANVPVDASLSNNFTLSLTADATLSNPTALLGGQAGTIDVVNTGTFNLSYGTMWRPVVGATTTVKQGAGGFSIITFKTSADGTKILFNVIQEQ